jgi:hypothetical protein
MPDSERALRHLRQVGGGEIAAQLIVEIHASGLTHHTAKRINEFRKTANELQKLIFHDTSGHSRIHDR